MSVRTDIIVRPELSPRLIIVQAPSAKLVLQDLHDTMCAWQDRPPNHDYDVIIASAGREDLGDSVEVGITTTLQNAQVMFEARVAVASGGTVTTPDTNGVVLNDAAGDFTSTVTRGDVVLNVTDGSKATVLNVVDDFQLRVDGLTGGSDNQWGGSDAYEIFDVVPCLLSGGNLTAIDDVGAPLDATLPSFGTQIKLAFSSSATIVSTAGLVPTQQEIRDAMKLAASSGDPDADSLDLLVREIRKRLSLDPSDKFTTTPSQMRSESGDIIIDITGDEETTSTGERQ